MGNQKGKTIIITKKTQRKLRSICNDKGTVKEKSIRHSLSSIMRWRGAMISEGVTIVVGTVDSLSEELVSCVVGMDRGVAS